MKNILLYVYAIGWVLTYWSDSSKLYSMGYSFFWSVICAMIDATIWPVRWGWDVVVYILNKRGTK